MTRMPLAIVLVLTLSGTADAAQHGSPLLTVDPAAEALDVYAFVSPDRLDSVTIIGTWEGFQARRAGPMFHRFDDSVLYTVNIDPVGDGLAHLRYELTFTTTIQDPNTYLHTRGPVGALSDANLNVQQAYRIEEYIDGAQTVLGTDVPVSPPNVGPRTMPTFPALFASAVHTAATADGPITVFAGQTDDPAFGDRGPLNDVPAAPGAKKLKLADGSAGFNVNAIAIQFPIARLNAVAFPGNTVIGVWTTSARRQQRTLSLGDVTDTGPFVQIARMGMPLFHDVVLPLALKDALNGFDSSVDFSLYASGSPAGDLFKSSVEAPEVAALLAARYGATVPPPPRSDVFDVLFQGIVLAAPLTAVTREGKVTLPAGFLVNRPTNPARVPAEMLRLNVHAKFRPGGSVTQCPPKPDHKRGLLGGDLCGFPNGRRLADDAGDIMLQILAGALHGLLTGSGFPFDPKAVAVAGDKTTKNDVAFSASFPYLAPPHRSYGGK